MHYTENEFFQLDKKTAIFLNSVIDYLLIELTNGTYSATISFIFPNKTDLKRLRLHNQDISAISINQTIQSIGQQIHNYKFLIHGDEYYLSLDPDESLLELSEQDQDFILFRKLTATMD